MYTHSQALGGFCLLALAGGNAALAQTAQRTDPVVITGTRVEERRFDVPAAVDSIDGEALRDQQLRVNLSETLVRVPGLLMQNRQNYAQDLQVSSRGFGARATFGVRGVRLMQDGIPLTMPDGQGQTATFDLDGAGRVEVLRGPFAALYGNASGGVIHLFTEDAPAQPTVQLNASGGSFDTWRSGLKFGAKSGAFSATGNVARFDTEGYREHSAARRDSANVKLGWQIDEASTLKLIGNWLDQPDTQDPLGLTQAQMDADRRQAIPATETFNTSKSIRHSQAGLVYQRKLTATDQVELLGYSGQRQVTQRLSVPVANQGITSSGGIVDLDRDFSGVGAQWRHSGTGYNVTLGLNFDRMQEVRQGFVNNNGVQGDLRRDETDTVKNADQFAIANWQFAERWKLSGGVRHSTVKFDSADRFIVGPNPDDSGSARYSATLPVVGLLFQLNPEVNLFASVGKGFETPTFAELGYRPDGLPGLNFDLRAATSVNAEVGVKAQLPGGARLTGTLFRSNTKNEVVAATSSGGRNTFTNVDRTRREGAELALDAALGDSFSAYLAYTYTRASFERYVTVADVDLSGKRIPGVPRHQLYGEVSWQHAATGLSSAVELRTTSQVFANDANSAAAGSYNLVNWRAGWKRTFGGFTLNPFVRVENLFNEKYVGSVIVNDGNQRFFEPAPTRAWFVGVNASAAF
jgi:iron complex outermembrane receptor protein